MKHIQKRLDCCIAIQYNDINIQLLCSRAAAFRWGFGPPLTYVCGYCKRRRGLSLKTHYDLMLQSYYLTEMNIYGRNTWKTLAHSAAHSSSLSLSEIHNKMSAANVAKSRSYCSKKNKKTTQAHTHSFDYDRMWGSRSENKAESFGRFDQRSLIWRRGLVDDLVFLPLGDHRVAHCHHCQELTDLR